MRQTDAVDTNGLPYLESILAGLPYCVMIVDRNLQAINCNAASLKMLGISSIDQLPAGAPVTCLAEAHRPAFRNLVIDAFDKRAADEIDPFEVQLEYPRDHPILAECRLAPLINHDGDVDAVMISFQNISVLRSAENRLEQADSILQSILKTIPDAMIVIDEDGIVSSFSATAEKMFGYDRTEIIGQNIKVLMPEPDKSAHDGYLRRYLDTGEKRIIGIGRTVAGCKKDGTVFPIQLEVGEANIGEERYFTGFIVDLTEKTQTEAELQSLQADLAHASRLSAVGTLASALAHEINQPLTAISNYLSAARDLMEGDLDENREFFREALQESVSESLRAGTIVRRLREFVSRGEINRRVLSIAQLVEDATTLGMVGAEEKGVQYSIDISPDAKYVFADRVQIQQVMVNLMRNAVEAMTDSSVKKLHIGVIATADKKVEISVSDTGPGIDEELGDKIFDPFASTKGDGMGLGLSVCRTIIEAHDGTIDTQPRPEGGTIFRFILDNIEQEPNDDD